MAVAVAIGIVQRTFAWCRSTTNGSMNSADVLDSVAANREQLSACSPSAACGTQKINRSTAAMIPMTPRMIEMMLT